jgi:hypothetical protein
MVIYQIDIFGVSLKKLTADASSFSERDKRSAITRNLPPKKESGRRHYQAPFTPTLLFAAEAIQEHTYNTNR